MPHKHKRKRGKDDDNEFDLPPSQRAQPLLPSSSKGAVQPQVQKKRKKSKQGDNDAPRGFRRMMAFSQGKRSRPGLDDGQAPKSKPKPQATETQADALRIRPGEDMGTFSARVNAALPVSGLTRKTIVKDGVDEQGVKVWRTRKEKNMHKLYDQWRAEEAKIQEMREEEAEEAAEREMENDAAGITAAYAEFEAGKKKKKKGRGKDDDDPWATLKKKRAEGKPGLHDVAQAPPQLHKATTRALKVRGDATVDVQNIPKAAGSLRRREELQQTREQVLEAYRKIREHEQAKLNGLN